MKKQFFYAALAIGMMSSCTSSDLPGNQAPEEQLPEEERVAIELGISSPNAKIEASTKGIGSVGGTGDPGDENNWNGETLGIWMYKVGEGGSLSEAYEPGSTTDYIFKELDFKAPSTGDKGTIEIFKEGTETHQVKYYPSTGKFAFYGYHIDDAGESATPDYDNRKITGLSIDGTQDIMAALTLPVNEDNYRDAEEPVGSTSTRNWDTYAAQSFSAWAARRKIQPILSFEHKLARLRFFVKAGDATAASKEWKDSQWEDRRKVDTDNDDIEDASQAVQITSITIDNLQSALDLSFVTEGSVEKSKLTPSDVPNKTIFTLMSPNTDPSSAELIALIPQAPTYWSHAEAGSQADGTNYKEKDQVGATMMFLPWNADGTDTKLTLKIGVQQAVLDTYGTDENDNPTYKLKSDEMTTTLDANKVKISDSSYATEFEAGKSYDVTIIVYSYQRIEIEAKLSAWQNGGSVEVAPGDEF